MTSIASLSQVQKMGRIMNKQYTLSWIGLFLLSSMTMVTNSCGVVTWEDTCINGACSSPSPTATPNQTPTPTPTPSPSSSPTQTPTPTPTPCPTPSPSGNCFSQACATQPCLYLAFTPSGNLGGISGADNVCNGCSKPSNVSSGKAIIVDGTNRIACTTPNCSGGTSEHTDWPLAPSTTYYRSEGTPIATTTSAGVFSFPLTNTIAEGTYEFWTGLNEDWTSNTSENCSGWTNSTSSVDGNVGRTDQTGSGAINIYRQFCDRNYNVYLLCVSQ